MRREVSTGEDRATRKQKRQEACQPQGIAKDGVGFMPFTGSCDIQATLLFEIHKAEIALRLLPRR